MERRSPVPSNAEISSLEQSVESRLAKESQDKPEYDGTDQVISTGSTLLDLAISGDRFPQGGIPGGILVEIFGPSGCGKTVMLCELAGSVQRQGGEILFRDPEARLNTQFAALFGLNMIKADYEQPDTVTELFTPIRDWEPKNQKVMNGIFADSLAALSTDMEMEKEEGDKMGMRRAKEFSQEFRKICRILPARNIIMVCSNQVRVNVDTTAFTEKYTTPGGVSVGFYSSLRLRCHTPQKINLKKTVGKKEERRTIGVQTTVEVYKSSVGKPYRSAPISIIFDYGIDDIRANLEYVKSISGARSYVIGDRSLGIGLEAACRRVETEQLEEELKQETIRLWHEVEDKFDLGRSAKRR